MLYEAMFYRSGKANFWRWKLMARGRTIARSERGNKFISKSKRELAALAKALGAGKFTVTVEH